MASSLLLGVNLAGAEFGSNVPGVFGTDYTYPTHSEIDYYAAKGMGVVRLPFLWERIQRSEFGQLDAAELGRLDDVVSYATGRGLKIEIEPHNYGYGFGALIGGAQTPNAALPICGASSHFTFSPIPASSSG
jgi:endoglucanase